VGSSTIPHPSRQRGDTTRSRLYFGTLLGARASTILLLGEGWGHIGGNKRDPTKKTHFYMLTFSTKLPKMTPLKGPLPSNFLVPFLILFPRCATEAPRTPKITKNDLPDRFLPLVSWFVFRFFVYFFASFLLGFLSLTDRTLPRNGRQLRPSSGLQNTLTQNWRALRPYSNLQNSLSYGLQSSLPKKWDTYVLLVTYRTTCQKNGAGSFHGDSDC
jgi:hypothetical protein